MRTRVLFVATLLALAGAAASPAPSGAGQGVAGQAALPSDSIYQLTIPLTDQAGKPFMLSERRGAPTIVSMFYTSCQFACPMLVDAVRVNQQKLSEPERQRLKVLMVSFDPEHDTVAKLQKTAQERQLDAGWTLARTEAPHVRKLAALLGVQYKAIGNGDFNHSAVLILVDGDGRIVGRTTQLADADPKFVKLLKTTLAAAPGP